MLPRLVLVASIVLASFLGVQLQASSRASQGEDPAHSPLQDQMEGLQSSLRRLRAVLGADAERPAALEVLGTMQGHALAAYSLEPPDPTGAEDAAESPGDARAARRIAFRRSLLRLLDQLLVIELAVLEGRAADAQAGYEDLVRIKNESHESLQVE